MVINGWKIFYFVLFAEILSELERDVTKLKQKLNDADFKRHPKAKLLASVFNVIKKIVPVDPNDRKFFLGNTLGPENKSFRRVKKTSLPPRYRLFFKFFSEKGSIIYIWLNDDSCLRKDGDKNDVYKVFQKMVGRGEVPKTYHELHSRSSQS